MQQNFESAADMRQKLNLIYRAELACTRIPLHEARVVWSDRNSLSIAAGGSVYELPLRVGTMMYLSQAAWGKADYLEFRERWQLRRDENLEDEIENGIRRAGLHLLVKYAGTTHEQVYGLIPGNFEFQNPNEFRDELFGSLMAPGLFQAKGGNSGKLKSGEFWESFPMRVLSGERMDKNLVVIYGLNNGNSSFRLYFRRSIISCANQLSAKSADLRWKHNSALSPAAFALQTVEESQRFAEAQEFSIQRAIGQPLERPLVEEFFHRLHTPVSVKQTLHGVLKREIQQEGQNEFALSQAMTWLATHRYGNGRDLHHAGIMRTGGSDLLTKPLATLLSETSTPVPCEYGQSYGWLLPGRR